tara:strand:+ start:8843 stop:9067 length:225 start_codon:yes stop_codon:yes gene_type:complete
MFDPNKGNFNISAAEQMLGMTDDDRSSLKMIVSVDLLCAFAGITDEQISLAYKARVKTHIEDAAESLKTILNEE